MKICIINGQNHKGSTYHIQALVCEHLGEGNEFSEFFLPRDLNHFCLGCFSCLEGDEKCPFYEEKRYLTEKMEEADILIVTTPNYCMLPSAPLKAFIDLTFSYWMPHRPRESMMHKKALVISSAAGMGASSAIKGVKKALFYMGVPCILSYPVIVNAKSWSEVSVKQKAVIAKKAEKLALELKKKKVRGMKLRQRFLFSLMALNQKNNTYAPYEKEWWQSRGWLDGEHPW